MHQPSIFITGAAAGIGKATALRFLAGGWRVGAFDIDAQGLESLANAAAAMGCGELLITGQLDVTNNDSWQATMAEFTEHTGGSLTVLFNNAGILVSGPLAEQSLEAQQRLIQINVQGVFAGCYLARPYLAKGSRVINMSSASAIYGQPSLAAYSTSKFAVRGLTEALSLEWESAGIQVMDVMPLFVQTNLVTNMNASSIRRLGVRLTPADIALTVWRMAHYRGNRVHWAVGLQTKLMVFASKLTPAWLLRLSNKWIAG